MVHTTVPGYVASSHKDMGKQALLASTVLKLQQKNEQKKPTKKKKNTQHPRSTELTNTAGTACISQRGLPSCLLSLGDFI